MAMVIDIDIKTLGEEKSLKSIHIKLIFPAVPHVLTYFSDASGMSPPNALLPQHWNGGPLDAGRYNATVST